MIAIIPARAGSERLENKNFMPFAGTTLVDWAVEQAFAAGIKSVYISTDLENWMPKNKNATVIYRPPILATETASSWLVVEHVTYSIAHFGSICLLQPTSPLRSVDDIKSCIELANSKQQNCTSTHKGSPNGAIYIRRWKKWDDLGILYNMPWVRSCDIDVLGDMETAQDILGRDYVKKTV